MKVQINIFLFFLNSVVTVSNLLALPYTDESEPPGMWVKYDYYSSWKNPISIKEVKKKHLSVITLRM